MVTRNLPLISRTNSASPQLVEPNQVFHHVDKLPDIGKNITSNIVKSDQTWQEEHTQAEAVIRQSPNGYINHRTFPESRSLQLFGGKKNVFHKKGIQNKFQGQRVRLDTPQSPAYRENPPNSPAGSYQRLLPIHEKLLPINGFVRAPEYDIVVSPQHSTDFEQLPQLFVQGDSHKPVVMNSVDKKDVMNKKPMEYSDNSKNNKLVQNAWGNHNGLQCDDIFFRLTPFPLKVNQNGCNSESNKCTSPREIDHLVKPIQTSGNDQGLHVIHYKSDEVESQNNISRMQPKEKREKSTGDLKSCGISTDNVEILKTANKTDEHYHSNQPDLLKDNVKKTFKGNQKVAFTEDEKVVTESPNTNQWYKREVRSEQMKAKLDLLNSNLSQYSTKLQTEGVKSRNKKLSQVIYTPLKKMQDYDNFLSLHNHRNFMSRRLADSCERAPRKLSPISRHIYRRLVSYPENYNTKEIIRENLQKSKTVGDKLIIHQNSSDDLVIDINKDDPCFDKSFIENEYLEAIIEENTPIFTKADNNDENALNDQQNEDVKSAKSLNNSVNINQASKPKDKVIKGVSRNEKLCEDLTSSKKDQNNNMLLTVAKSKSPNQKQRLIDKGVKQFGQISKLSSSNMDRNNMKSSEFNWRHDKKMSKSSSKNDDDDVLINNMSQSKQKNGSSFGTNESAQLMKRSNAIVRTSEQSRNNLKKEARGTPSTSHTIYGIRNVGKDANQYTKSSPSVLTIKDRPEKNSTPAGQYQKRITIKQTVTCLTRRNMNVTRSTPQSRLESKTLHSYDQSCKSNENTSLVRRKCEPLQKGNSDKTVKSNFMKRVQNNNNRSIMKSEDVAKMFLEPGCGGIKRKSDQTKMIQQRKNPTQASFTNRSVERTYSSSVNQNSNKVDQSVVSQQKATVKRKMQVIDKKPLRYNAQQEMFKQNQVKTAKDKLLQRAAKLRQRIKEAEQLNQMLRTWFRNNAIIDAKAVVVKPEKQKPQQGNIVSKRWTLNRKIDHDRKLRSKLDGLCETTVNGNHLSLRNRNSRQMSERKSKMQVAIIKSETSVSSSKTVRSLSGSKSAISVRSKNQVMIARRVVKKSAKSKALTQIKNQSKTSVENLRRDEKQCRDMNSHYIAFARKVSISRRFTRKVSASKRVKSSTPKLTNVPAIEYNTSKQKSFTSNTDKPLTVFDKLKKLARSRHMETGSSESNRRLLRSNLNTMIPPEIQGRRVKLIDPLVGNQNRARNEDVSVQPSQQKRYVQQCSQKSKRYCNPPRELSSNQLKSIKTYQQSKVVVRRKSR